MQRPLVKSLFAIALLLGLFIARAPAHAAVLSEAVSSAPDSLVQTVQYYVAPRYYARPRYYGRRHYRPYRPYVRPRYHSRRHHR